MAFNTIDNRLFCITPDNKMKIFDCNTNNLIAEVPSNSSTTIFSNLVYDETYNCVFWSKSSITHGMSKITAYSSNGTILYEKNYSGILNPIFDFIKNPTNDSLLYASTHQGFYVISASDLSTICFTSFGNEGELGKITYNSVNNQVYVDVYTALNLITIPILQAIQIFLP